VHERRLTLLAEGLLNDPVAAGAFFEETGGGAAVKITPVAVVTLLAGVQESVAAIRCSGDDRRFEPTGGGAAVTDLLIAVVALFIDFLHIVAADRLSARFF